MNNMNLTLKERLDLQKTARIITESQYKQRLAEAAILSDKEQEIVVKKGLNVSSENNLNDPNIKTLIDKKELGSFTLSGKPFVPNKELDDDQMLHKIKDMLSETDGFFNYSDRLVVFESKVKEEESSILNNLKGYINYVASNGEVAIDYNKYDNDL
jgi:hypothetical protein